MRVLALAGGVGGAKLVDGLAQNLPPSDLVVVVNTGDDFEHLGLRICPDLDTVCYTLAGFANPDTGWGRSDESWNALESWVQLGGPDWFRLGDRDLGTHLDRTRRLRAGEPLHEVTANFCAAWGIGYQVLPMSNDPIPTRVLTGDGELAFQEYFVRLRCQPVVRGFRFEGGDAASPAPGVLAAIRTADLVVICPSNPWVSIDPILAVPGIRPALLEKPTLAVSPIIGGETVKGPAAKMYAELGFEPSAYTVSKHYAGLIDGFVLDQIDRDQENAIQGMEIQTLATDTWMKTIADRFRLAQEVLDFGQLLISDKFG